MPVVPEALLQTPRFPQACLSEVGTSVLCSSLEQLHDPRIDLKLESSCHVSLNSSVKKMPTPVFLCPNGKYDWLRRAAVDGLDHSRMGDSQYSLHHTAAHCTALQHTSLSTMHKWCSFFLALNSMRLRKTPFLSCPKPPPPYICVNLHIKSAVLLDVAW